MAVDLTTRSYDECGVFNKHEGACDEPMSLKLDEKCSLKNFKLSRVIKECSFSKSVVVEGTFLGDDKPAIVIFEKTPFDTRDISQLFTGDTKLELKFRNNIYANYHVFPPNVFNGINIQVIYPAQEKDYLKFLKPPLIMITESKQLFDSVVNSSFKDASMQKEKFVQKNEDQIIPLEMNMEYEFTFVQEKIENCQCLHSHIRAKLIFKNPSLMSVRDLTADHIPCLKEAQQKCIETLSTRHNLPPCRFTSYIRYPPTSFPLHIHFETVERDEQIPTEQAHSLDTVICDLQLISNYYQMATLYYSIPEDSLLAAMLKENKNGGSMDVDE